MSGATHTGNKSSRGWVCALGMIIFMSFISLASHAESQHKEISRVPSAIAVTPDEFKQVISNLKGRVLVINVWATWCVPCLREIPDLLKLQAEFSDQGVRLIGIAVDEPSAQATEVEQFRKRYFPEFLTYARTGPDLDELTRILDPTWNEVVPTTYIIDRAGRIKYRIQGKKSLVEFRTALQTVF